MNTKTKIYIPVIVALVAIVTIAAVPALAESGAISLETVPQTTQEGPLGDGDGETNDDNAEKGMWQDGPKHHNHMAVQVDKVLDWTVPIPADFSKDTMKDLKNDVTVSLVDAATAAKNAGVTDVMMASIGIINDQADNKFVAWILSSMDENAESGNVTANIFLVDAGNVANNAQVTKEFDPFMMSRDGDHKWSEHKMQGYFADLTPEQRDAKATQFKEMKQAFASLSEEDQALLHSHFKGMKGDFANLTEDEKAAKFDEHKQQMEAFMKLSLDEKISYLKNLALGLKN